MRHLSTIRQSCLRASFAALASVSVMKETASAIDAPLVDDVSALQQQPTFNYGGLNSLYVVGHATAARWTFLSFDPVSAVPTTTNKDDIAKATLYLYVNAAATAGSLEVYTISAWPYTTTMKEGTATGAVQANTVSWGVSPAITKPTVSSTLIATLRIPTGLVSEYVAIDVTAAVKGWIDSSATQLGLALKPAAGSSVIVSFDSKENVTTAHRPVLDVTIIKKRVPQSGDVSMGTYINGTLP